MRGGAEQHELGRPDPTWRDQEQRGAGKESEVRSGWWLEESCVWAGGGWRERAEHP